MRTVVFAAGMLGLLAGGLMNCRSECVHILYYGEFRISPTTVDSLGEDGRDSLGDYGVVIIQEDEVVLEVASPDGTVRARYDVVDKRVPRS